MILEHQIRVQVHGLTGGLSSADSAPASVVAKVAEPLATAFGNTFWWVLALTVLALVPALLLSRAPAAAVPGPAPVPLD